MKDAPGGDHTVLKGTHSSGVGLVAIGYRYSSRKTLMFIMTEKAGSTAPGEPYEMKFVDEFDNLGEYTHCDLIIIFYIINLTLFYLLDVRFVDRSDAISKLFRDSNVVDKHNQSQQLDLALEKKWITINPYFRLTTTFIGIGVTDTWLLVNHNNILPTDVVKHYSNEEEDGNIPIKTFSGALSKHLIKMGQDLDGNLKRPAPISPERVIEQHSYETGSNITHHEIIGKMTDGNGDIHHIAVYPTTATGVTLKKRRKARHCLLYKDAGKLITTNCYCVECGDALCYSPTKKHERECFECHLCNRSSPRSMLSMDTD